MTKIKKFKVNLRKREIIHNFKVTSSIKQITQELEDLIAKEIDRSVEYLSPASMFDTFQIDKATKDFKLNFAKEPDILAVSIIVVTVGDEIEKQIGTATSQGEQLRAQILNAIGIEACSSSLNFIYKLISDEAEKEECKVSPIEKVQGDSARTIIKKFNTKRIGVYINDKNQILPEYTAVATVKWLPLKKSLKSAR
ncbi:MAG: hypothetical protein QME68_04930 [Elusimicrobiota bacterium]|nr:hypothetical protein [Elusimicrobiota bacterium]